MSEDMRRHGRGGGVSSSSELDGRRLGQVAPLWVVGRARGGSPVYSGVGSIRRGRSLLSLETFVVRLGGSHIGRGGCSCGGQGVKRSRRRGGEDIILRSLRNRRKSTLFQGLTAAGANPGAPVKKSLGAGSFPRLGGIRGWCGSGGDIRGGHGGTICLRERAMSTTRKIRLTYDICMFVMDNDGRGNILQVLVVNNRLSSRGRLCGSAGGSLLSEAGRVDVLNILVQGAGVGGTFSGDPCIPRWAVQHRSRHPPAGKDRSRLVVEHVPRLWQRFSQFRDTVMVFGWSHQLPSGRNHAESAGQLLDNLPGASVGDGRLAICGWL